MENRCGARRKPVYGLGINDSKEPVTKSPYYKTWHNMMKRCYDTGYQAKQPTYIGCSVCKEWLTLSSFEAWMRLQDWQGKELDKDILNPGNKVYSPQNCAFVSRAINSLLNQRRPKASGLPQGVYWCHYTKKYRAELVKWGRKESIGRYDTPQQASTAYKKAKARHIREIANSQSHRLRSGLMKHAEALSC